MPDAIHTEAERAGAEPTIRLDRLHKRYPGQAAPAVSELSMDVHEGEIVVLVGPSGCGKTTTLKMINRIIEPTAGRIVLEGEDVTSVNPDRLRRRIGYAIQQVGLYPHLTIADNVGVVPKMLGWDRRRIAARVDELLALVGLDPTTYRGRYPKQLSGGQQQRVGVARALGADPPVMLMDEPFGAIDPINRENLQNEFLRIQQEVRKTIVFVTHDIDEAIKMGDRIAILREGSEIAQYDTPANILADPADEFVADFIGAGASVRRLRLTRVSEVKWLPAGSAGSGAAGVIPAGSTVAPDATLFDALDAMLRTNATAATVVDETGADRGVLTLDQVRAQIHAGDAIGDVAAGAAPGEGSR